MKGGKGEEVMYQSILKSTYTVMQVTYNDILTMNIFGDLEDLEGIKL